MYQRQLSQLSEQEIFGQRQLRKLQKQAQDEDVSYKKRNSVVTTQSNQQLLQKSELEKVASEMLKKAS